MVGCSVFTRPSSISGKAGVVGNLCDRQAAIGQQPGGATGGQQLNAQRMQASGQFEDAGLVGNGEKRVHGRSWVVVASTHSE